MSLIKFQDNVFLDYKTNWFVWEPAWESFRPIQSVEWNGDVFQIQDSIYCSDPTDVQYGYGSTQMKKVCDLLTQKFESEIPSAKVVTTPVIGSASWFRDRHVVLSRCAPLDVFSWKRMCHGRVHTCKRIPRGKKFTRRNL